MQSVPIITDVVGSTPAQGEEYKVIKFVSDLRHVGGFLTTRDILRKRSTYLCSVLNTSCVFDFAVSHNQLMFVHRSEETMSFYIGWLVGFLHHMSISFRKHHLISQKVDM
jgi:hypothetical protein